MQNNKTSDRGLNQFRKSIADKLMLCDCKSIAIQTLCRGDAVLDLPRRPISYINSMSLISAVLGVDKKTLLPILSTLALGLWHNNARRYHPHTMGDDAYARLCVISSTAEAVSYHPPRRICWFCFFGKKILHKTINMHF